MGFLDQIINEPALIIATIAATVSIVSIVIAIGSFWIQRKQFSNQRKHNRLSVRPIGKIILSDYTGKIAIKLKNVGIGPMIVKNIETSDNQRIKKKYPIDWMPSGISFKTFRKGLENNTIMAGEYEVLLQYNYDPYDNISTENSDVIRSVLKDLEIRIIYTDVYDKEQPELKRPLKWFGRTL